MQELWPLHVKPSEVEHSSGEAKVVKKITTVMRVVIYVYPLEPPVLFTCIPYEFPMHFPCLFIHRHRRYLALDSVWQKGP